MPETAEPVKYKRIEIHPDLLIMAQFVASITGESARDVCERCLRTASTLSAEYAKAKATAGKRGL